MGVRVRLGMGVAVLEAALILLAANRGAKRWVNAVRTSTYQEHVFHANMR